MNREIILYPSDFKTSQDWLYFLQQAGIEDRAHEVNSVLLQVAGSNITIRK